MAREDAGTPLYPGVLEQDWTEDNTSPYHTSSFPSFGPEKHELNTGETGEAVTEEIPAVTQYGILQLFYCSHPPSFCDNYGHSFW